MNEELTLPQLQGTQGLEQFLLLAKTAKGAAAAQLIQDVTNSTGVLAITIMAYFKNQWFLLNHELSPNYLGSDYNPY